MQDPRTVSFGGFQSDSGMLIFVFRGLNTYLYGIATFQYASYLHRSYVPVSVPEYRFADDPAEFKDPRWIKWTLSGLFVSDTLHSASIIYLVWLYLWVRSNNARNVLGLNIYFRIEGFNDPRSAIAIHWPLPLSVFIAGSTAFIVQTFLSYRIFLLSKMKTVVGVLVFLSMASFSFAISVVVRVSLVENQLSRAPIDDILITCWLSLEVLVDLLISASGTSHSDRIVKRLARVSVTNSSIFAFMCMILWLAQPRANYYLIFGLPVSRCTLLRYSTPSSVAPKLREMLDSDGSNGLCCKTFGFSSSTTKRVSKARPESHFHAAQTNGTIKFQSHPVLAPSRSPRAKHYAGPRRPDLNPIFPPSRVSQAPRF
ncbi:hypothetical protein BKA70DRAFT_1306851 [Coprinopsis sp. MPI-PUGE-AT-0042]|nr:hypothetical protein BKA70DRAFT_1306851 [Coprinopsis sp. MPI-PUGE-AT-0042]